MALPDEFEVPLFPLPGIVLFPGTLLPLRVFEPRYLKLLKDVMASEKLIGMAQLKPAEFPFTESADAPPPPIYNVVGVGQVIAHEALGDGTFHIALMGQARCRIKSEIPHQPYRIARVTPLWDMLPENEEGKLTLNLGVADMVKSANALVSRTLDTSAANRFKKALKANKDASSVTDLLASIYIQDAELRQSLLETADVLERTRILLSVLEKLLARPDKNPPKQKYSRDEICLN
jgi:uncharacterized protein